VSGFAAAMSTRVPVSVIVPIINEAANLPRCLDCVKWADEIFVIDSESTDDSIAIARQHGAKVVAVRIQWHLAEEKELGTRERAVSQ